MKEKAATLLPPQLDYWVAKAEKIFFMRDSGGHVFEIDQSGNVYARTGGDRMYYYQPSSEWRLGGPLIDRHEISVQKVGSAWVADRGREFSATGDTALIAAMRVRVILAFGETLEDDG